MLGLVGSLADQVKLKTNNVKTVGIIFKLHYHLTTLMCFLFCLLIMANDLFGAPMVCEDGNPHTDTYCWVSATFTINTTFSKNYQHPTFYHAFDSDFKGIGEYDPEKHAKRTHLYYQWVPIILFIQGCMFYIPYALWKMIEKGKANTLLQDMNVFSLNDECEKKQENVARYFMEFRDHNMSYFFGVFFCEILNLINVIGQMMMLDKFLGGIFMSFGIDIIKFSMQHDSIRHDPLIYNFPRLVSCTYHKYGSSGGINSENTLCLLPQNILNEKIFVILWFWFVFLAFMGALKLAVDAMIITNRKFRCWRLLSRANLEMTSPNMKFVQRLSLGDYYLLNVIGKNMNPVYFKDTICKLMDHLSYPECEAPDDPKETGQIGFRSLDGSKVNKFYMLSPLIP